MAIIKEKISPAMPKLAQPKVIYTVANRTIGFTLEQSLRNATLACTASGILK
ncbi:MAG: hypothetical protein LBJ00_02795 [Planctomycetaceae bacterium]|nr:hypothetical protein [Planctomycetaceae bacterium]